MSNYELVLFPLVVKHQYLYFAYLPTLTELSTLEQT